MASRIDDNFKAAVSAHSGASRPSYAVAGTIWISTATAGQLKLYLYDGSDDTLLMVLDTATNAVTFSGLGTTISAATAKAAPTGADKLGIWDSAAGDTKSLTLTNLSAWLASALGPDFVEGGIVLPNGSNPQTHLDIASFTVKALSKVAVSSGTLTKNLNSTWVAGNNGGLDTGVKAANATYFVYALRKQSDGTGEVVLSTSATVGGVNTSLLTGYDVLAPIGVVLTDGSSNIREFTMEADGEYTFISPVKDAANIAISTTSTLLALTVPNGVRVKAKLRFEFTSSATTNAALLSDPAQGALVAGIGNDGPSVGSIQVASGFAVGARDILTNTSKQIRYVAGAAGNLWVWTDGFIFPCKRTA
ncbi:hypothetical protein GGE16_002654 [Rhizobium leguminosarum]|uniref:Tail fiber protein n=2 Tax=Rhizobium TaxID=379 RepID=A0AAE2MKG9_RHILE|nr:hypothetical protein [Rhizobium leguminosarum]MBB4431778.1 hypothetical protein [Rhizobium esperanzae]MBB4297319.1 hypothetical protein [Rhizobium leguminosarum]MBB4307481.1 hypothetical protein [Rhizobium leguminosarum]MBB4415255.1 hypothetical protein [Rhizobium leguminosarum]